MSFLVDVTSLTATYYDIGRYLLLEAEGETPALWLDPFFQKEELLGGLEFSVRTHGGGPGPAGVHPETKKFNIQLKFPVNLPLPGFNSKTVTVETRSKTWNVDIAYVEWAGPGAPDAATQDLTSGFSQTGFQPSFEAVEAAVPIHYAPGPVRPPGSSQGPFGGNFGPGPVKLPGSVLTPINKYLPAGGDLTISAKIPPSDPGVPGGAGSKVDISFSPEFFTLVAASVYQGSVTWTLTWNKLPTGVGQSPQLVDVTTATWQGGVHAAPSKVIQGYSVSFVVFDAAKQATK